MDNIIILKFTISILLAFTFLVQSASKMLIIADYQLNKEYISKNLCENKNKPKMHCNGKCHLAKQLKKQEKKESSPANQLKEKLELQFFSNNNFELNNTAISEKSELSSNYLLSNYSIYLESVYQPPQLA